MAIDEFLHQYTSIEKEKIDRPPDLIEILHRKLGRLTERNDISGFNSPVKGRAAAKSALSIGTPKPRSN